LSDQRHPGVTAMTLVFYTRMKVILSILGLIYLIFKDCQMQVVQNHFALTIFR